MAIRRNLLHFRCLACWVVEFNYKCPFNTGWQQQKWPFQVLFRCPRPLNRGVPLIKVSFKVNKGNKFGDFSYCPLNRGCLLNTGFTVLLLSADHRARWPLCNQLWEHCFSVPDLVSSPRPCSPGGGICFGTWKKIYMLTKWLHSSSPRIITCANCIAANRPSEKDFSTIFCRQSHCSFSPARSLSWEL